MGFLDVSGISRQLQQNTVVNDISFSQPRFQKLAIAGETGSGKSTLLKMIAGLEQPDAGQIFFKEQKVLGPLFQLIPGHPGIAYLSQHYELRNNYRVEEWLDMSNRLPQADADALFRICRIDHLLNRKTDQLSGGEKQRIALCRLLIGAPELLLLDEPFSNLDPIHKQILKQVLDAIGNRLRISCILTSHDPQDTLSWADELLVMRGGQLVQKGSPQQLYYQPVNEYVAGLLGSYVLLPEAVLSLFTKNRSWPVMNQHYLVRPEQFRIVPEQAGAVKAVIEQVGFWGAFFEIKAAVAGNSITIKTMDLNQLSVGDHLYLQLADTIYR
ncbi:MAG: ABC transporter ATP-binding protein [Bacteroidetes bacterium]|nr:ABC transporter ATP-binding protein [Bacteroidota bacterium]